MGSKEQVKTAGREIESDDHVDRSYLMNMMNETCQNCIESLTVDLENDNIVSNVTRQRVDNAVAHFKSNCIGLCHTCNCAFSNKIAL